MVMMIDPPVNVFSSGASHAESSTCVSAPERAPDPRLAVVPDLAALLVADADRALVRAGRFRQAHRVGGDRRHRYREQRSDQELPRSRNPTVRRLIRGVTLSRVMADR